MRILLTGFDRFGGLNVNPSQIVVQTIAERAQARSFTDVVAEVLPTEFNAADTRIRELIYAIRPEAIVSLGVAPGLDSISLERVALNLDDSDEADNAGDLTEGRLIVPDGPAAYWSTLPLECMRLTLQERNIPIRISNHAGTYVCNHVFYVARHTTEQLSNEAPCGFIHVPLMSNQVKTSKRVPSMPLTMMVEAIECCLEGLQQER